MLIKIKVAGNTENGDLERSSHKLLNGISFLKYM